MSFFSFILLILLMMFLITAVRVLIPIFKFFRMVRKVRKHDKEHSAYQQRTYSGGQPGEKSTVRGKTIILGKDDYHVDK